MRSGCRFLSPLDGRKFNCESGMFADITALWLRSCFNLNFLIKGTFVSP